MMGLLMDTRKYEALQRVVELGQFSKAAEALGYTQSALSQMIASLESELGFKVIDRTRTGSHLNIEGKKIFPLIEKTIYADRSVREAAAEIRGIGPGVVRIGTIASVSAHWLPKVIRRFEEKYPEVEFVIHQGDYTMIPEWVKEGAIDFGFVNPEKNHGLVTIPLKTGQMSAVLPKDHPLAALDTIPLKKLAKEPFILLEEGGYYEPMEVFERINCKPRIKYTIHDDYSIMSMIHEGLGVSILPDLIMQRCPYDLAVRPTDPCVTRTLAIVHRGEGKLSIAATRFIEELVESAPFLP